MGILTVGVIPATAAPAQRIPWARFAALPLYQGILHKSDGTAPLVHLFHGIRVQIADTIIIHGVEIAGEHTAISLHQIVDIAVTRHSTVFRRHPLQDLHKVVKIPNGNHQSLTEILIPQVKEFFQKLPIGFGREGILILSTLVLQSVHAGNVLLVIPAILFVKAIDLRHRFCQLGCHHGEYIELHMVSPHQLGCPQYRVITALAIGAMTVQVVGIFHSVQGQANEKMIFSQKLTPLLVQQDTIGLEGIGHCEAGTGVLFLQLHHFLEEIQPGKGGFSSLEGKRAASLCRLQKQGYGVFQNLVGHNPIVRDGSHGCFVGVEAVLTPQITPGAGRLYHNADWMHDGRSPPNLTNRYFYPNPLRAFFQKGKASPPR